jgi:hypothetical protein
MALEKIMSRRLGTCTLRFADKGCFIHARKGCAMKKWTFTSLMVAVLLVPVVARQPETRAQTETREQKPDDKMTSQSIDGEWSVVYATQDGKKLPDKSVTGVAVKDNVLRFTQEGHEHAWRLEFGPNNAVKAIKAGEAPATKGSAEQRPITTQMRVGVCIASPEYLCLALNRWTTDLKTPKRVGESEQQGQQEVLATDSLLMQPAQDKVGPVGSSFVLILRREVASK